MYSYTIKTIQCMCCGFTYKAKILKGFYNSSVADLDTYTHLPAVYDRVIMCPNCGYSTEKISAEVSHEVIEFIHSDEYQKFVQDIKHHPLAENREILYSAPMRSVMLSQRCPAFMAGGFIAH